MKFVLFVFMYFIYAFAFHKSNFIFCVKKLVSIKLMAFLIRFIPFYCAAKIWSLSFISFYSILFTFQKLIWRYQKKLILQIIYFHNKWFYFNHWFFEWNKHVLFEWCLFIHSHEFYSMIYLFYSTKRNVALFQKKTVEE